MTTWRARSYLRAQQMLSLLDEIRAQNVRTNDAIAAELNQRAYPPPEGHLAWSAELVECREDWSRKKLEYRQKKFEHAVVAAQKLLGTVSEIQATVPGATMSMIADVMNKVSFPLPNGKSRWKAYLVREKLLWAKGVLERRLDKREAAA